MIFPSETVQKHNVAKVIAAMLDEEVPAVDARIEEYERRLQDLHRYRTYLATIAGITQWTGGPDAG